MGNLGTWIIWSLPFYIVLTSRLKGQKQNLALWVYLWTLSAFWGYFLWHGYQLETLIKQQGLDARGTELQAQYDHVQWLSIFGVIFVMALPPFKYFHDRRKLVAAGTQ